MDRLEAIDGRSLYVSNEYPDLDLAPTYLWVGRAGSPHHHNNNVTSDGSSRHLRKFVHDGLAEEELEQNRQSRASNSIASGDNQENSRHQSSSDIDPDFKSPEDYSTQVLSSLEM